MFPRKVLFEGANQNLIVFNFIGRASQKFSYDEVNYSWTNLGSSNAVQLQSEKFVDNANVVTGKFTNDLGQKFGYEYCGDENGDVEGDH